jgi:peptide chain release factor 1
MLDFDQQHEVARGKLRDLEERLSSPEVLGDPRELTRVTKVHSRLNRLAGCFAGRQEALRLRDEAREMLEESGDEDDEMAEMAREECQECERKIEDFEGQIRLLLLPPDPNDERNTILEIRAGTGGDEAALFAADLARMYQRFSESRKWKMSLVSSTQTELGGFKEAIFTVEGDNVYSALKFESGGHRVQRVPVTETQGRIHTSAVTVAVLPEAKEVDIEIRSEDLRVDTFHSTGPGGQSVNTTDSAVRLTHLPTGLVVSCQDEKSQLKNRTKALKVLRARLLDAELRRQHAERASERSKQVGSGDRSGRVRTYNFPENRLTDHRVNFRSKNLEQILQGALEPIIEALTSAEQARRLAETDDN